MGMWVEIGILVEALARQSDLKTAMTSPVVQALASKWLGFMDKGAFGAVILDLNSGKAHLHYTLSLKLAHWQELPCKLATPRKPLPAKEHPKSWLGLVGTINDSTPHARSSNTDPVSTKFDVYSVVFSHSHTFLSDFFLFKDYNDPLVPAPKPQVFGS